MSNLNFDRATGCVTGSVTVPTGVNPNAVTVMVGPEGVNGFPALELEQVGPNTWQAPANQSAQQCAFVLQNLSAGNLYLAVRTPEFPTGELRRQIDPAGTFRYETTHQCVNGGSAVGIILVNEITGDYSITYNTTGTPPLSSAHLNDGVVSGTTENVLINLTQRPSNPSQFFRHGNFMDPNDPLPNIEQQLFDGQVFIDAHLTSDDSRECFGQLQKL